MTTPDTGSTGGRLCRLQLSRSYTPTRHLSFLQLRCLTLYARLLALYLSPDSLLPTPTLSAGTHSTTLSAKLSQLPDPYSLFDAYSLTLLLSRHRLGIICFSQCVSRLLASPRLLSAPCLSVLLAVHFPCFATISPPPPPPASHPILSLYLTYRLYSSQTQTAYLALPNMVLLHHMVVALPYLTTRLLKPNLSLRRLHALQRKRLAVLVLPQH